MTRGINTNLQSSSKEGITSLSGCFERALSSGKSGGKSMLVQVHTMMWMHTIMNYQYRHGGKIRETMKLLYAEGGFRRFYRGYPFALVQGPLCRFVDTFTHTLVFALFGRIEGEKSLPISLKTVVGSVCVASFRLVLLPVDTLKTFMQVEGSRGFRLLRAKIAQSGLKVMYQGAGAAFAATLASNFPWFFTYNYLNKNLPKYDNSFRTYARHALIGFLAAVVADTTSNSFRVLKTTLQTSREVVSYKNALKAIRQKDGLSGVARRGLRIKLMINGTQSMFFSMLWRYFDDQLKQSH